MDAKKPIKKRRRTSPPKVYHNYIRKIFKKMSPDHLISENALIVMDQWLSKFVRDVGRQSAEHAATRNQRRVKPSDIEKVFGLMAQDPDFTNRCTNRGRVALKTYSENKGK